MKRKDDFVCFGSKMLVRKCVGSKTNGTSDLLAKLVLYTHCMYLYSTAGITGCVRDSTLWRGNNSKV